MAYSEIDHQRCLDLYKLFGRNMSKVAREKNTPSRRTLITWANEGLPVETTGGLSWDEYLDRQEDAALTRAKEEALTRTTTEGKAMVLRMQDDVEDMLESIKHYVESGRANISAGDYERLARLWMQMANVDREKLEWMEDFMRKVANIILDVVDEHQFAKIKAKMADMATREAKKLNLTRNV